MLKHICKGCAGACAQWGPLILRLAVGAVFFAHGAQKLFGWFGGPGIAGTAGFFGQIGLAPAAFWAWVVAFTEFFGGIALILGLVTSVAAVLLAINMAVALFAVHLRNGFFLSNGGAEYVLTLFAASVALALTGPGAWALNNKFCRKEKTASTEAMT